MDVAKLLKLMVDKGISDIHFKADAHPAVRVHGNLVPATNLDKLSAADVVTLINTLLNADQQKRFATLGEMDLAYNLPGIARFRVNVFRQRGTSAVSLRVVPHKVKSFEDLNLPLKPVHKLAEESRGLILFAGITGAGKTTSMNSFLHHLNQTDNHRIITIEDPIEYYHEDIKASVVQREVGRDTKSYGDALKNILRQDPDVVVIGEMRDQETISAALTAAETGHLVLSTIHTMDAVQTIDRIVDSFPAEHGKQVRQQLAMVLKGIVAQRLVVSKEGGGRFPATEVLIVNSLVRKHIMEAKNADIRKAMEGGDYYGMHTFDTDLIRLFEEGKISEREALENSSNPEDLQVKLKGSGGAKPA